MIYLNIKEEVNALLKFTEVMQNPQRKIIAVGGAKGGIGKSVFASNLGVFLCARKNRTVLADLDLGGATLHLYLGETTRGNTINDFLTKKVLALENVMRPTRYGPYLICGNSSQLGAANIHFARKLKLLKAIKNLEADYVILDLGGDTSYNVIDCFLAADYQLVFTTCDPASYLEAYSFIKVALFRKLERMFGPESPFWPQKNTELESIIRDFVRSANGADSKPIGKLIKQVNAIQPQSLALIKKVIRSFSPQIVVNLIDTESAADRVVTRIQEVAQKVLCLKVGYLGCIPFLPEIQQSARDLVPVVVRDRKGRYEQCIDNIISRFLPSFG